MNIEALVEKNQAILDRLSFQRDAHPYELRSRETYLKTGLFSEEIIDDIFSFHEVPAHELSSSVPEYIGMLLIRPEMTHITPMFKEFIDEFYTVCHTEDVEITTEAYWKIYRHDLYRPETLDSRLTRAAIYIGSLCRLVVFKDENHQPMERPVSDKVFSFLKGKQGIYQQGTLRGEVVYNEALNLGFHRIHSTSEEYYVRLSQAIDPFGAYRRLSERPKGPHAGLNHPILFYTAVGVHVPNAKEVQTDLPIFLSESDILSL